MKIYVYNYMGEKREVTLTSAVSDRLHNNQSGTIEYLEHKVEHLQDLILDLINIIGDRGHGYDKDETEKLIGYFNDGYYVEKD